MIILDFGSGNTCKNNFAYVNKMLAELKQVDSGKHKIVIKWQLFKEAGDNIPLDHDVFKHALIEAKRLGYKTTASVFDKESLAFLLDFDVPFIKIANNPKAWDLIQFIPRGMPVIRSADLYEVKREDYLKYRGISRMACISKYPATLKDYEHAAKYLFDNCFLKYTDEDYWLSNSGFYHAVSDHTVGLELYHKHKPEIWEKHYKLEDSTGLDAGPFAITPEELKEIL